MKKNARITQNQESTSRQTRSFVVALCTVGLALAFVVAIEFDSAFELTFSLCRSFYLKMTRCGLKPEKILGFGSQTLSHPGLRFQTTSVSAMSFHFELDELGRVAARVARRAKLAFRILHGLAEGGEREISERISFQVPLDLVDGMPRRN